MEAFCIIKQINQNQTATKQQRNKETKKQSNKETIKKAQSKSKQIPVHENQ